MQKLCVLYYCWNDWMNTVMSHSSRFVQLSLFFPGKWWYEMLNRFSNHVRPWELRVVYLYPLTRAVQYIKVNFIYMHSGFLDPQLYVVLFFYQRKGWGQRWRDLKVDDSISWYSLLFWLSPFVWWNISLCSLPLASLPSTDIQIRISSHQQILPLTHVSLPTLCSHSILCLCVYHFPTAIFSMLPCTCSKLFIFPPLSFCGCLQFTVWQWLSWTPIRLHTLLGFKAQILSSVGPSLECLHACGALKAPGDDRNNSYWRLKDRWWEEWLFTQRLSTEKFASRILFDCDSSVATTSISHCNYLLWNDKCKPARKNECEPLPSWWCIWNTKSLLLSCLWSFLWCSVLGDSAVQDCWGWFNLTTHTVRRPDVQTDTHQWVSSHASVVD